ncbi:hypothetical protein [Dialister micraerophilus]|uniref:hypothetical protein n=1 Tax=Dialister micraerophilus TaxID=309120 RepID=UPI0023F255B2|nr:hypothetical protein [Dialister micraerophilus]
MLSKAQVVSARRAIESLYTDTCKIITECDVLDESGIMKTTRVVSQSYPCRLSYKDIPNATSDGIPVMGQSVKIFLAPEIKISSGSEIHVIRQDRNLEFVLAGVAAVYETHQEISLTLKKVHNG